MENSSAASIFQRFQDLEQKRVEQLQEAYQATMSRQQTAQKAYLDSVAGMFQEVQSAYQDKVRDLMVSQLKGETAQSGGRELEDLAKDFYKKIATAQQECAKAIQEAWNQGEDGYRHAVEAYFAGLRDVWTEIDPAAMAAAMTGGGETLGPRASSAH